MEILTGLAVVYGLVVYLIPRYLFKYATFTLFLTWFANVDVIANILKLNFPKYFKAVYNDEPESLFEYISFNLLGVIALSGIFIYGLRNQSRDKLVTFLSMVVMLVVTWVLPTSGIPFISKKLDNYLVKENLDNDPERHEAFKILLTTGTSLGFLLVEYLIIHNFIHHFKFGQSTIKLFREILKKK